VTCEIGAKSCPFTRNLWGCVDGVLSLMGTLPCTRVLGIHDPRSVVGQQSLDDTPDDGPAFGISSH
jgi:hypothetical protein